MYSTALSAAQIVSDMNTPVGGTPPPDTFPPTIDSVSPVNGATAVNAASNVTATFSEPMLASSISTSSVELRDGSGQLVPAAVTYDGPTMTATLNPTADLSLGTTYTATVRGGTIDPAVKDAAGNALAASVSWSFTTSGPPPNEGPGDPCSSSRAPGIPSRATTPRSCAPRG